MSSSGFNFLIGGARSGKSSAAVRLASQQPGPVTFVVTAEALDDEMTTRIAHHRAERPKHWATIEEPLELVSVVLSIPADSFVVIDCLSLWVANLMLATDVDVDLDVDARAAAVIAALCARRTGAAVVSNEVGLGIVPDNPLGHEYRDVLGRVNAAFARSASDSYLFVAGQAVRLAPPPF